MKSTPTIAVVIPSYKVTAHIMDVLAGIGPEVSAIYVVDDCCPDRSGEFVRERCLDSRVFVMAHSRNLGVGGATKAGYLKASQDGHDVIVKVDGDGQMDPALIPDLTAPLLKGRADYVKGNRFHRPASLARMPVVRLIGNAGLSFLNKLVTGYWQVMDPTNGFTAIRASLIRDLEMEKIENRYFFESDMLFRLGLLRARVLDFPMDAKYENERSNLSVSRTLLSFPGKYLTRFLKRMVYCYFLRDFNMGTVALIVGLPSLLFGVLYGAWSWYRYSVLEGALAPTGIIMLSALSVMIGVQFLTLFIQVDLLSVPRARLED